MTKPMVTVMVIGETGCGKSEAGCAFLRKKGVFTIGSTPESETYETTSFTNEVDHINRTYIDTQGLESTDGRDAFYIQQMIEFLKNWQHGVNAFYLVLNIQNPRFSKSIQTMIEIINDFFNDPTFWNQTGIIFTRCYRIGNEKLFDENMAKTQYRQKVVDFIKTLQGCENLQPKMPCFFVNSPNYDSDDETKKEFQRIFEFAHGKHPVPTQNMKVTSPDYKEKKEELLNNVLVDTKYEGTGENKVKILYYENQRRYKITGRNKIVSYSKPETIKAWTKTIKTEVKEETKDEVDTYRKQVFRTVDKKGNIIRQVGHVVSLGIFSNGNSTHQEHDHDEVTTTHHQFVRKIITDPDGQVSFGEWIPVKQWSETRNE